MNDYEGSKQSGIVFNNLKEIEFDIFEDELSEAERIKHKELQAKVKKNQAISSDDPEVIAKLQTKLEKLQSKHEVMKQVNTYYRKHKTMVGYPNLSVDAATEMDKDINNAYSWEKQPFPSYLLQKNLGNIRNIKKRIIELEKTKKEEGWHFEGGQVVMNTDENRIQIVFDEKPAEECLEEIKSWGFKWVPNNKAWQRQLNKNGLYAVKQLKCTRPKIKQEKTEEDLKNELF